MDRTCKNCYGWEGIHRSGTNQCPLGGVEAPVGKPDKWMNTTFEIVDSEIARLREALTATQEEAQRTRELLDNATEIIAEKNAAIMELKRNKGIPEMIAALEYILSAAPAREFYDPEEVITIQVTGAALVDIIAAIGKEGVSQ